MIKSSTEPKFAVLGTGNSGQTFAADIALKGFSVNLAEVPEFEFNLREIEKKGGIEISGETSNGFARLNMITTDLKEAIKGVDIIIIGGSAHAHEPFSKSLVEHFEDGQFILFTSNFGALRFHKWMKEAGISTRVTPVESMSLLYATRALQPGVVACIGIKNKLPVAALPASRTPEFLEKIGPIFPQFAAGENVWLTSINNLNPIVHPPMVLFNAGRIESTGGQGWNLYADGATESVAKVMLAMDEERMLLLDRLGTQGLAFKDSFENLYEKYSLGKQSLSETLRQSPIHGNPAFPAPSTVDTRYINEDLPFGLVPWSSIGRMWEIATPNIDSVIRIASTMLDTDFFADGLTVGDLGIQGMAPEEVRALIS
ncbi:MAG: NAD/NADP octopine/nopaline dehydrogenase family protein [Desulfobacterales bacterium]|nr:MAG: NAD/NADP octopine/nopaline dehydrogenase family protein [Desulfobacterales bacterium]